MIITHLVAEGEKGSEPMITKRKIIDDLGPTVTKTKLARYLGYKDLRSVRKYFDGLQSISGRTYFTGDVADNILSGGL